ncbi:transcription termination factor NusA [Candidatus Roizmanbacteria bacterium RIFCSPHIGHO2_12_FULL_38_13]|nr:MAG: transcription termination factor NusA [Candidatus Roizmanbacteria bacterium RIFCSPHIGHO2_12_FULL_38_13]
MVIVKSEFALALNQVASERGITVEDVISSMEAAILAAFKKEHPEMVADEEEEAKIKVKVNMTTGETHILKEEKDITPPGFGRIAAQTARQVIIQKIREAEKKTVISHYKDQVGTTVRGRVIRQEGSVVYVDIGKTEAILPREDQMRNESYSVNNRYLFYLKEIGTNNLGYSRIIVSRSAPELISEIFKREVPEISNGTVEIRKVVREPGERAKIAVFSSQSGVDPVGACVGQKGVRVQTVTEELSGLEKIDIIQWNENPKIFIISSLSPAKVVSVDINEEAKIAKVTVEESQAPLAIGKGGINVNLAARLSGYEIDIVQVPTTSSKSKVSAVDATKLASGQTKLEDKEKTSENQEKPEEKEKLKTEKKEKEEK